MRYIDKIRQKINEYLGGDYSDIVEESNANYSSDYSIVCFKLGKILKKPIPEIAKELSDMLSTLDFIEKTEIIAAYVNIYIKKEDMISNVLDSGLEISDKILEENSKKTILVEYSSPNIAKEFHIGHLKTTLIGGYIYRLNKYLGYKTIGINHLGDYGTQFGKMIEGYLLWKSEYDFSEDPISKFNDIYIRINALCKEDEEVLERCRDNFKKLEEGDPEIVKIWQYFVDISMKEFNKIYKTLGISFDEIRGESKYSPKLKSIIKLLEDKKLLKESKGAKIVDLEKEGLAVAIIQKSNDSSVYITRDIAAVLYRKEKYNFDECIYVVASEQNLHFKQLFKIMEYLGLNKKNLDGLKHVRYGMVRLPSGKMSTREGNVIKISTLLEEAISRSYKIISEKNPSLTEEEKQDIAKKVGISAVVFYNLSTVLIKDQVFVWDNVLNYSGETGVYIQYNYVRIRSILKEAGVLKEEEDDLSLNREFKLKDKYIEIYKTNEDMYNLIKQIYKFQDVLISSRNKMEPYILTSYMLDITKSYTSFYTKNKVLVNNEDERDAKIYLSYMVAKILEISGHLLGMQFPKKM